MGRSPSAAEMRRMVLVEAIITCYRDRKIAPKKGEWIKNNPDKYAILDEAYKAWLTLYSP